MSFEDDMIDSGFSFEDDYMDYLESEADKVFMHQCAQEEYYNNLYNDEMDEVIAKEDTPFFRANEKLAMLQEWARSNPQIAKFWFAYYNGSPFFSQRAYKKFLISQTISCLYYPDKFYCGMGHEWSLSREEWVERMYKEWYQWLHNYYLYREIQNNRKKEFDAMDLKLREDLARDFVRDTVGYSREMYSQSEKFYGIKDLTNYSADIFKLYKYIIDWVNKYPHEWHDIKRKYFHKLRSFDSYKELAWNYCKDASSDDECKQIFSPNGAIVNYGIFDKWKTKAEIIDLWTLWCFDGNSCRFLEWLTKRSSYWKNVLLKFCSFELYDSYRSLFAPIQYVDILDLRKEYDRRWKKWLPIIEKHLFTPQILTELEEKEYSSNATLKVDIDCLLINERLGKGSFQDDRCIVKTKDRFGYIDRAGKVVIDCCYNAVNNFVNKKATVQFGSEKYLLFCYKAYSISCGKWGVIDINGNFILPPHYDWLSENYNGSIIFSVGGCYSISALPSKEELRRCKYGIMTDDGNIVVAAEYDYIKYAYDNLFFVCRDELWGVISAKGDMVIPIKYLLLRVVDGMIEYNIGGAFFDDEIIDGEWGFMDSSGNIIPMQ